MARRGWRLSRDTIALGVALALHATLIAGVQRWALDEPPRRETSAPGQAAPTAEVDIDLSSLGPSVESSPSTLVPPASEPSAAPKPARQASSVKPRVLPSEPPPERPVASAEPAAAAPGATLDAPTGPLDLGIGPDAWQKWLAHVPAAARPEPVPRGRPLVSAPPVSSTGGLQEGLEASDRKLGMGPAGRVATALYQAAHGADAPEVGTALFNVTVLRTGAVEVSLGETTDKRWQAVATRAAEELRRSPPRIPPPREGYRLTLAITAVETMPNGLLRKDLHGARLGAQGLRFRSVKEQLKELELKNPTAGVGPEQQEIRGSPIVMDLPGVYVEGRGKVCGYRFGLTPLGLILQGGCDLANASAKFQRLVRTEVREQSAF